MSKALPGRKSISSQDVYNVRVRAYMLMRKLKSEGESLETYDFQKNKDNFNLMKSLDEITDDVVDISLTSAKDLYHSYLNDAKCSFHLFKFLDQIAQSDSGFTYNHCQDSKGNFTSFCWVTSHMRSHFERYHNIIS